MSESKPFASLSSGLLARKGGAKPAMRRPNININPEHVSENGQDDLGWNDMGYDVNPDMTEETPVEKPLFNPLAKAVEVPKPEVKQQQDQIAARLQASGFAENQDENQGIDNQNDQNSIDDSSPENSDGLAEIKPVATLSNDPALGENISENVENIFPSDAESILAKKPKPVATKPVAATAKAKKPTVKTKAKTAKAKAAFTLRLDPERHLKLRLACAINNISAQKFVTEALDQILNEMEEINHLSGQVTKSK